MELCKASLRSCYPEPQLHPPVPWTHRLQLPGISQERSPTGIVTKKKFLQAKKRGSRFSDHFPESCEAGNREWNADISSAIFRRIGTTEVTAGESGREPGKLRI